MTVNKLVEELLRFSPETEVCVISPFRHTEVPVASVEKSFFLSLKGQEVVVLHYRKAKERAFAKF